MRDDINLDNGRVGAAAELDQQPARVSVSLCVFVLLYPSHCTAFSWCPGGDVNATDHLGMAPQHLEPGFTPYTLHKLRYCFRRCVPQVFILHILEDCVPKAGAYGVNGLCGRLTCLRHAMISALWGPICTLWCRLWTLCSLYTHIPVGRRTKGCSSPNCAGHAEINDHL